MVALLALSACVSVIPEFEAAKSRSLAAPGPTPTTWQPDAVLHMSGSAVNAMVRDAIQDYGTFSARIDLTAFALVPNLELTEMSVSPGKGEGCDDCLGVAIKLDGLLGLDTLVGETSTTLGADGSMDVRFLVDQSEDGTWTVSVQPTRFRFLNVSVGPVAVGVGGLGETIEGWIDRNLIATVPPQEMMSLAPEDLPIKALRIVPDEGSVQFHLLTRATERGGVAVDGPRPEKGWRMDISQRSIVSLARTEAFKAEPLTRGIVPVPNLFSMDSDSFTLGLRLWRTEGRGWWRDYEVKGTVRVDNDEIKLKATDVQQVDKSPGAAAADPLVALARGLILNVIEKAFETSLPAVQGDDVVTTIDRIEARDGALRSYGSLYSEYTVTGPPALEPEPENTETAENTP
ncbi:MAG: hypothetical protein AAGA48_26705 [Myxococcota bacterium]